MSNKRCISLYCEADPLPSLASPLFESEIVNPNNFVHIPKAARFARATPMQSAAIESNSANLRLVTLMMTSPKAEELPWAIAELSESWWSVVYGRLAAICRGCLAR
jgi:hypothetical protein